MQYPGNLHIQYVYGNQANDPNTEMTILSNTIKGNTHDHVVLNQSAELQTSFIVWVWVLISSLMAHVYMHLLNCNRNAAKLNPSLLGLFIKCVIVEAAH